jgi:branched-chain amino acid aminotransferase
VIQRHIPAEELATFSEVFLCGTAAEVTPVSEIGPHRYTPGNISLSLMDDYSRLVRRELQPA